MFKFDADLKTVDSGVWAEFQGARFLIAHISNMRFQRALARYQQPHRRKLESGTLDPQTNRDILCRAMAEGLLLNWDKVQSSAGQETPYSAEVGLVALTKNVELRDFISEFSLNLSNFRDEEIEDLGKS